MKFSINSSELKKSLSILSSAISSRAIVNVLDNVKFSINNTRCTMMATDFNFTIVVSALCVSEESFEVLIPFKDLDGICGLTNQPITISVGDKIEIKFVSGEKYNLGKPEPVTNYPNEPIVDELGAVEATSELITTLALASKCVSIEEGTSNYSDVFVNVKKDVVDVFAMDNYFMFKSSVEIKSNQEIQIPIQPKFISCIPLDHEGKIYFDKKSIAFKSDKVFVSCLLSENKLPPYHLVFTSHSPNLKINRNELLSALNNMMIFRKKFYSMILTFSKDVMKIYHIDELSNKEYEKELQCEHSVTIDRLCMDGGRVKTLLSLMNDVETVDLFFKDEKTNVFIESKDTPVICALRALTV